MQAQNFLSASYIVGNENPQTAFSSLEQSLSFQHIAMPGALHDDKLKFLEEKPNEIREDIIAMLVEAGSGHSAGPIAWQIFLPHFIFIF